MDETAAVPSERRRRLRIWIPIVLLIALATWLWVGQTPLVVDQPVCLQRDESGQWHATRGEWPPPKPGLLVNVGATTSNESFSTALSTSSSDDSRFTCRHLMVIDRSDHGLARCVSAHLLDHLTRMPDVRRIEYYPPAHQPPDGGRAPDIMIALTLDADTKSWRLPLRSTRDIELRVVASTASVVSGHSYRGHLTPPLVDFRWSASLDCQTRHTGISNPAGRTQALAKDLAKSIAGNLAKTFTQLRDKHGQLPELPPAFYPSYRPTPRLASLDGYDVRRISTMCSFMTHNQTFWAFDTDREPADVFAEFQRAAEADGWCLSDKSPDLEPPSTLRMRQASSRLELFRAVETGPKVTDVGIVSVPDPPLYYVRYVERMTASARSQAIDQLLSYGVPTETLLLFWKSFSDQHRDWVLHLWADSPPTDYHAWLTMAELHHKDRQAEAARHALLQARIWCAAANDLGSAAPDIKRLAKRLGDENLARAPIDVHALDQAGFVRLNPPAPIAPRDVESDQPVVYYAVADGRINTLCLRMCRTDRTDGTEHVKVEWLKLFDLGGGSGSAASSYEYAGEFTGSGQTWRIDDTHSATFIVNRRDNTDDFRVAADWIDTPPAKHVPRAARSDLPGQR